MLGLVGHMVVLDVASAHDGLGMWLGIFHLFFDQAVYCNELKECSRKRVLQPDQNSDSFIKYLVWKFENQMIWCWAH